IIKEICKNKYQANPVLFEVAVGILSLSVKKFKDNSSILKSLTCNDFTYRLKHQDRYHLDWFNTEIFEEIIGFASTTIEENHLFYRSRIANNDEEISSKKMGSPLNEKSLNARLNPRRISYLYLVSYEDITIKEVRARMHDSVTIGSFELLKKIEIIDLTKIDKFSPFLGNALGFDYEKYAVNNEHLRNIAKEFLIPTKRNDSF